MKIYTVLNLALGIYASAINVRTSTSPTFFQLQQVSSTYPSSLSNFLSVVSTQFEGVSEDTNTIGTTEEDGDGIDGFAAIFSYEASTKRLKMIQPGQPQSTGSAMYISFQPGSHLRVRNGTSLAKGEVFLQCQTPMANEVLKCSAPGVKAPQFWATEPGCEVEAVYFQKGQPPQVDGDVECPPYAPLELRVRELSPSIVKTDPYGKFGGKPTFAVGVANGSHEPHLPLGNASAVGALSFGVKSGLAIFGFEDAAYGPARIESVIYNTGFLAVSKTSQQLTMVEDLASDQAFLTCELVQQSYQVDYFNCTAFGSHQFWCPSKYTGVQGLLFGAKQPVGYKKCKLQAEQMDNFDGQH